MPYLSSILPKYFVKGISFTVTFPEPLLTVTLAVARLRSPNMYRKTLRTSRSNNYMYDHKDGNKWARKNMLLLASAGKQINQPMKSAGTNKLAAGKCGKTYSQRLTSAGKLRQSNGDWLWFCTRLSQRRLDWLKFVNQVMRSKIHDKS